MKTGIFQYNVYFILDTLKECGYKAYLVGGCVRDWLMDRKPKDWDICTNATPEQVKEVFKDKEGLSFVDTGIKHGTITLFFPDKTGYEITTFRIDKEYTDNRHCEVEFTSDLQEDLARRDFTINALAYNYDEGIQDYFGGQEDLNNEIIRCVGNPDERFNEDALRILRALRFKTQLDFEIEEETEKSLIKNAHLLENISRERIRDELNKILYYQEKCHKTINKYFDVFKRYVFNTDKLTKLKDNEEFLELFLFSKEVYLAYLLKELPVDEAISLLATTRGLRYDNKTIDTIKNIMLYSKVDIIKEDEKAQKYYLKKLINAIGDDEHFVISYIFYATEDTEAFQKLYSLHCRLKYNECCKISDLVVNGNDLKEAHFEGKEIGYVLNIIFEEVIRENINNNIHSINHFIRENYNKLKKGVYHIE